MRPRRRQKPRAFIGEYLLNTEVQSLRLRVGRLLVLFALYVIAQTTPAAEADDFRATPVSVVPVSNAPIAVTKCKLGQYYWWQYAHITNRTSHALLNVTFRFNYFDADGAQIGTVDSQLTLDPPLVSGDDQMMASIQYPNLSETQNAIARVTCRIEAASFSGLKKWTYGQRWPEPLSRMSQQSNLGEGRRAFPNRPNELENEDDVGLRLSLAVVRAWNDVVRGNLFVHVALHVHGGDTEIALRPEHLALTLTLSNNARKSYTAMTGMAPTYQKFNPLGNTTLTVHEVDPKDDLGGLGSIIIPARGSVNVTATFNVGHDPITDPTDNRQVTIR
jgi:hypothetical protein